MKRLVLLVLFLTLGSSMNSSAKTLQECDALYANRGNSLLEASSCYQSLLSTNSAETKKMVYERTFIALSSVVNDSPKTEAEGAAIAQAINLLTQMKADLSGTADYLYWHAVFISFQAIRQDRGSLLPRHIFGVLKTIQSELNQAIQLNPSLHLYGPSRVLGVMHTQMPGIVGGDKSLAEKLLLDAYSNAPQLSANHVNYAKILIVNGEDNQATQVLKTFLSQPDSKFNPYPSEPLRILTPELTKDRELAKKMLADLSGE